MRTHTLALILLTLAGPAFAPNFGPGDPTIHGATLRVFSNNGDTFDATYSMPHSNWQYMRTPGENAGYSYKDLSNTYGPIKFALIRNGRPSKVKGGGPALGFSLGGDPNPVNVVLQLGTQLLAWLAVSGVFISTALVHTGGLQGTGDTKSPLYISIASQIIVPLGLCSLIQLTRPLVPSDIWMAVLLGHMTRSGLSIWRFRQGRWRSITVGS